METRKEAADTMRVFYDALRIAKGAKNRRAIQRVIRNVRSEMPIVAVIRDGRWRHIEIRLGDYPYMPLLTAILAEAKNAARKTSKAWILMPNGKSRAYIYNYGRTIQTYKGV